MTIFNFLVLLILPYQKGAVMNWFTLLLIAVWGVANLLCIMQRLLGRDRVYATQTVLYAMLVNAICIMYCIISLIKQDEAYLALGNTIVWLISGSCFLLYWWYWYIAIAPRSREETQRIIDNRNKKWSSVNNQSRIWRTKTNFRRALKCLCDYCFLDKSRATAYKA